MKATKWLHGEHVVSSAVCPPAVRTMMLVLSIDMKDSEKVYKDIVPVLAIETRIFERYSRRADSEEEFGAGPTSRKLLLEEGYELDGREIGQFPVFIDLDGDMVSGADHSQIENASTRMVACPWSPDEDAKHFEPFFMALEEFAREKMKRAAKKAEA